MLISLFAVSIAMRVLRAVGSTAPFQLADALLGAQELYWCLGREGLAAGRLWMTLGEGSGGGGRRDRGQLAGGPSPREIVGVSQGFVWVAVVGLLSGPLDGGNLFLLSTFSFPSPLSLLLRAVWSFGREAHVCL